MKWLKKYLYYEIGIEFKACLYYGVILFYYFFYRILQGSLDADIPVMIEMVLAAYFMGYLQLLLLSNFDEAERLGKSGIVKILLCSLTYTVISYLLRWFDRNLTATVLYFFYMLLCYGSVFLIYKLKRDIDTVHLNRELEQFKSRKDGE